MASGGFSPRPEPDLASCRCSTAHSDGPWTRGATFANHLCPPNADAIMRALAPVIPDRVTAGWNQLLCSLSTGLDTRKNDTYVDICFMGLKGGSGGMKGTDGTISLDQAREAYGVVLDEQTLELDEEETEKVRGGVGKNCRRLPRCLSVTSNSN